MKKRRTLTARESKDMLRRYSAGGETAKAIAAAFGVDPSYPGLLAKRSGVALRHPNRLSKPQPGRKGAP